MVSQTVLLKGVNADADTLEALMRGFVVTRIKPYYLHHGDLAPGTSHFRTTIAEGQAIMEELAVAQEMYREAVRNAVRSGKNVPQRVLAEARHRLPEVGGARWPRPIETFSLCGTRRRNPGRGSFNAKPKKSPGMCCPWPPTPICITPSVV
jgi:hypothetical protein